MLRWLSVSFNYLPSIFFSWNHKQERDFPGGSAVKKLPAMQEIQVGSLGQEDPLEKKTATHSRVLA